MPLNWYALVVMPQHERAVAGHLETLGFETFVPLYRTRRKWSDRVKLVEAPLFRGYTFARFSADERLKPLRIPGVRSIVSVAARPAPIPVDQINAVKRLVGSGLPLQPWPFLKVGDRVRIERGPLAGVEGILLEVRKSWQVVVSIELLQRSVAVRIDREMLARAAG